MTCTGWEGTSVTDISRIEQKYPITLAQAQQIRKRLALFAPEDPHNGPDGYWVNSVYFDTPNDRDYRDKRSGENIRQKVRLRVYGEEDRAKLELKEKLGAFQRKRSLSLNGPQAEAALRGDYSFLRDMEGAFAGEMYLLLVTRCYRPKVRISYRRRAFCLPENDTRITFDGELSTGPVEKSLPFQSPTLPVFSGGWLTLEVKYRDFLLSNLKLALGEELLPQASIGKYSLSRQASGM